MLNVKREPATTAEKGLLAPPSPTTLQAELDLWQHLVFSFDMDKDDHYTSQPSGGAGRGSGSSRARSASTPSASGNAPSSSSRASAQRTGAAPMWPPQQPPPPPPGGPQNYEELARALRTIQEAYPFLAQPAGGQQQGFPQDPNRFPPPIPAQLPAHLFSQLPWPSVQPPAPHGQPPPQFSPDFSALYPLGGQFSQPSAFHPPTSLAAPISAGGESSHQAATPAQDQEGNPLDSEPMTEEKRRRNTAASARFRIKKKLKTLNLERTVSDLTGRVDELEQEAADLRRENGWLKEIVMLKSSRAAGGDLQPVAGPSQPPGARDSQKDVVDDDDDDDTEQGKSPSPGEEGPDS